MSSAVGRMGMGWTPSIGTRRCSGGAMLTQGGCWEEVGVEGGGLPGLKCETGAPGSRGYCGGGAGVVVVV